MAELRQGTKVAQPDNLFRVICPATTTLTLCSSGFQRPGNGRSQVSPHIQTESNPVTLWLHEQCLATIPTERLPGMLQMQS